MKPFSFFKFVIAIAMSSIIFTSCSTDDTGGTGSVVAPKVDLVSGTGVITSDATVAVGETFTVNLVGTKGDNAMKSITVNEAGTKISDLTRLSFSHTTGSANPIVLTGGNTSAFDIKVTVTAHTDISSKAYSFVVADDQGNTTTKTINITTVGNPPVIVSPTTTLNFDRPNDSLFVFLFKVTKGSAKLSSVEVQINGTTATDLGRIFYDNLQTPFTTNPYPIPAADQDAFSKDIVFRAPSTPGTYTYKIIFKDAAGQTASTNMVVVSGVKVNMLEGILLNQSGPTGQGALDLDTGQSTGTVNNTTSEIRDEGIVNLVNDPTWKQQISGFNGAEIQYIKKGQNGASENFDFADVKFKDQVASLWANGVAFTKTSTDNLRKVSDKVAVGDNFIVKKDTKYYLLTVKKVDVTTNDNKDSYTFDVKF